MAEADFEYPLPGLDSTGLRPASNTAAAPASPGEDFNYELPDTPAAVGAQLNAANQSTQDFDYSPIKNQNDSLFNAVMSFGKGVYHGFLQAGDNVGRDISLQIKSIGDTIGSATLSQLAEQSGEMYKGLAEKSQTSIEEAAAAGPLASVATSAGVSQGYSIPSIVTGLSAAGGNPLGALEAATIAGSVMGGLTQKSQSKMEALDQGLTESEATMHGYFQGAVEALTGLVPLHQLFKDTPLAKKFFSTLIAEEASESVATLLQSLEEARAYPKYTVADWWNGNNESGQVGAKEQLAYTLATVPLIAGTSAGVVRGAQKIGQIKDAYQMLVQQKGAPQLSPELSKMLDEIGRDQESEDKNSVITYHGDNAIDEEKTGQRGINPGQAVDQRVAGLISSESNGWMGSYTFGPGTSEDVRDQPGPPLDNPTDLSKFTKSPLDRKVDQMQEIVKQIAGPWQSDIEANVVAGPHQLPDEILQHAKKHNFSLEGTQGLYDGGNRIYLFANNIQSVNEVPRLLAHEAIGHYGMERIIPNWNDITPLILDAAPKEMPAALEAVQNRGDYLGMDDRVKAKEILATFAEQNPHATNSLLDIVKASLRNFLRNIGFNIQVNNADVVNMLRKARNVVESGTRRKPGRSGFLRHAEQKPLTSPTQYRSEWDPSVRKWGEALFDTANFPIFEDMSPNTFDLYSKEHQDLLATGKPAMIRAYHGSPQGDREGFEERMLGQSTGGSDSALGHFFGTDPENATSYSQYHSVDLSLSLIDQLPYADRAKVKRLIGERLGLTVGINTSDAHGAYYEVLKNGKPASGLPYYIKDNAQFAITQQVEKWFEQLPYKEQLQILKDTLKTDKIQFTAPVSFPVYIAAKNPYVADMEGREWDNTSVYQHISAAINGGHDVTVVKNMQDPNLDNVVIVHAGNEHQIRSVNAKFDTDISSLQSNQLLAARGKLYRVRLNREMYLDLEKPLSEQPQKVQNALREGGIALSGMQGQQLYDALVKTEGSQEKASAKLDKMGIHGASWQEAFKGNLVRNYATFSRSNAVSLSANQQRSLGEQKALTQKVLSQSIRDQKAKSPEMTYRERFDTFIKAVKVSDQFARMSKDDVTKFNWWIKYTYGIEEIAAANPELTQLQNYLEATRGWWGIKGKWTTDANAMIRKWNKVISAGAMGEQFDTFMYEADLQSQQLGRRLTADELQKILKDNKLDLLKTEQLDLASKIWDSYTDAFNAVKAALIFNVGLTISDPVQQLIAKTEIETAIDQANNKNYLPKTNFGEWTIEFKARNDTKVNGRDFVAGEVVHYSTHVTESDADKAFVELRKIYPEAQFKETRSLLGSNRAMEFVGIPDSFYRAILDRAELDSSGMAEIENVLDKLKHENSPASRLMRRVLKNTKAYGYERNSQRVYGKFMQTFSNQIAKLNYGPLMQAAINNFAETMAGDATKKSQILDYMRQHRSYMSNPGNELSWLRGMGFNFYIGLVPKAALVNLTQVALVSHPYLSEKYGTVEATKALMQNMYAYFSQFKNGQKVFKYSNEKLQMFQQGLAEGWLNESNANELAAVVERGSLEDMLGYHSNALRTVDGVTRAITDKFAFLFHHSELFNRYITSGAAYDLARKAGDNIADARAAAGLAVRRTQGEYARYNRPLLMQGKRSAVFLFMRYLAHMMYFIGNEPAKWRVLFMWLLAAGLTGLPFASNLMDMLDLAATQFQKHTGYKDPKYSSRLDLMRFLETLRPDPASPLNDWIPSTDTIMHGLARRLPLPGGQTADVSNSISLGNIIPGTAELAKGPGQAETGQVLTQALGAVAQMPLQVFSALGSENPDTWKLIESTMPTSVRNISAAVRWYQRGNETNSKGQPVIEFDPEKDISTILYKAVGFTPTKLAQAREVEWMQNDYKVFYNNMRSAVMKDWANAIVQGNTDQQKAAMAAVQQFNKQVPYPQLIIGPDALRQSAWMKARSDALQSMGYPTDKRYIQLYQDIGEVHEKAR